jgi:hypothetical protein
MPRLLIELWTLVVVIHKQPRAAGSDAPKVVVTWHCGRQAPLT